MTYTLSDFIHNLNQYGSPSTSMQNDDLLDYINEHLPKNVILQKVYKEQAK